MTVPGAGITGRVLVRSCRNCVGSLVRVLELEARLIKATGLVCQISEMPGLELPASVRSDVTVIAGSVVTEDRSLSMAEAVSLLWDVYRAVRPEGHVGHALIDHADLGRVCCMPGCDLCRLRALIEDALNIDRR